MVELVVVSQFRVHCVNDPELIYSCNESKNADTCTKRESSSQPKVHEFWLNIEQDTNAALGRLAHATANKDFSPVSPLQALVRANDN